VRFIAFVNEESPFFYTNKMGSYRYARDVRAKKENIVAMLSLESMGYYSTQPRSQHYPFPFSFFYPDTGDFIGFVGNLASLALVRQVIATFRQQTPFPSEGVAAPGWMIGVGWSDQWAFWKYGYSAVMVTGTALFRNPNYHRETDTPHTIDYERTARVVNGLVSVIRVLAGVNTS
jgi:Zn-dependent M28 family amino/carboxypeptidase